MAALRNGGGAGLEAEGGEVGISPGEEPAQSGWPDDEFGCACCPHASLDAFGALAGRMLLSNT